MVVIAGAAASLPRGFAMPPQAIAERTVSAFAVAPAGEAHGHVHEDGKAHLPFSTDHTRDHDPADHSHETPGTPPGILIVTPHAPRQWESPRLFIARLGTSFRLDRPPRSAAAA